MSINNATCQICNHPIDDFKKAAKLTEKGCNTIQLACQKRNDTLDTTPGQFVHVDCRKQYCNPKTISHDVKQNDQYKLCRASRSNIGSFTFKEQCLFCGQSAKCSKKKRGHDVFPVRTLDFQRKINDICTARNDNWSSAVRSRLEYVSDLPAADALYHQTCNINFRTNKDVPSKYQTAQLKKAKQSPGRPKNPEAENAFNIAVNYLQEHADEQLTILDIVNKMKDECGEKAYSPTYTKYKLEEYFGESVIMSNINGKLNVITLQETAGSILHDSYCEQQTGDSETEKTKVLKAAAQLIINDIKTVYTDKTEYPNPDVISSTDHNTEFIPDSLVQFLRELFSSKDSDIKVCSIGQAIMQATRPRSVIAPLQLGLAVQLHHHFASKYLIDILNSLGFCVSYSEVQMFESSAAMSNKTDINNYHSDMFIQYVADNVDHNLRTLDGHNTFHGMGLIACVTPGNFGYTPIKRAVVSSQDLVTAGKVDIHFYRQTENLKPPMTFVDLNISKMAENGSKIIFLSNITWPLRVSGPDWSGLMQMVRKGDHPGKSSVVFLPMIDMDPGDMSCIYTTLAYVSKHARNYQQTAIVTFDQPLYWKAMKIVCNENDTSLIKDIVVRLGGFHCIMSYLGCIGQLMSGSGLNELMETVYASNVVPHMMSGKAVSRALRGHSLAANALSILLMKQCPNIPLHVANQGTEELIETSPESHAINKDMDELVVMHKRLVDGEIEVESVYSNTVLEDVHKAFLETQRTLLKYPTAALWIQYLKMVDILRTFISAERTGQWELSLNSLREMLPYFAAAGHNLYLKSVYFYLQCMQSLPKSHPEVYIAFTKGYNVVRRSDRFWAGLSPDLIIEQVLMRGVKTTGGMTRGKGLTESQRAQWLLSMPSCVEYNNAMQSFCGKEFQSSPQHRETGTSRIERDLKDTKTFMAFFEERNPFRSEALIFNIETGVTADSKVNAYQAKSVGESVVESMKGKSVFDISFKRSQQAITIDSVQQREVDNDLVKVDPQLLFQRLSTAAQRFVEDIPSVFAYELCSVPSSLFDPSGLLRKGQKSLLADSIWAIGDCSYSDSIDLDPKMFMFVLDGGSLLHHVPWKAGLSFIEICESYIGYISANYPKATVVFDGYRSGPSTKDTAHIRRTHGVTGTKVFFTRTTPFTSRKEKFLSNLENKQNFIYMLSNVLKENNYGVVHADADADSLIVHTALQIAEATNVVIIGEDTDILVLLLYHMELYHNQVLFRSAIKQRTSKGLRVWDIKKSKLLLGLELCRIMPVIHAISGCDTTSQLFGIGKGATLKKFRSDVQLVNLANVFLRNASKDEVTTCGEHILILMYGGLPIEGLNNLRFTKFTRKVVSSTVQVQVQTLPPTSAAAKYHSMRTFYQVHEWIEKESKLDPTRWGWSLKQGKLMPIKTDIQAAPETLLHMIRCNCKQNCDSKRCTCRKNGLDCSSVCGDCKGTSCSNSSNIIDLNSDSETE